ncbi:MAG: RNA 2',3'-cyclic phosphodiesterase [Candidatus Parabeggiatoa sp. nov. 2]|nr:MAG: 2'-5' RNA ligase [Beggiatoa sp. 4572_84]RKZ58002.1 MAG: RNA 2',3'-cyclic phosphodiesterase [Gammaproteobacteria bacterium]HEC84726.1 RNA 2',3'-cyclic phosphodiesterase [Thioploca sp.]
MFILNFSFFILNSITMSNNSTERLFFALWPDDNVRQAINELSQPVLSDMSGKIVPPENWHITLAFLGEIDRQVKQCVQQVATTVQASRFSLSLDKLDYWAKPRILWLGASETPEALQGLVATLSSGLQDCGYRPDTRPFQAHFTLMRKAARTKTLPPVTPLAWAVEDFCLVRSILDFKGARYEVIERWAFGA